MTESDRERFAAVMLGLAEIFGESMSETRLRGYFAALEPWRIGTVEDMVRAAVRACRFFPKPAELIDLAPVTDGHLGPEEAWALVAGLTEDGTVVWTDEIASAYGIAVHVLPDRVGARMAFLAAYGRMLAESRRCGSKARWWASLGDDAMGRAAPVEDAVLAGRLSPVQVRAMLPPSVWPASLALEPASAQAALPSAPETP